MTATYTLYGLTTCDSCRRARRWLDQHGLAYRFHDLRDDGLDRALLLRLEAGIGWERLLNQRSTTWRSLAATDRAPLDRARALDLMLAHPTLLKRPVLDTGEHLVVGFEPERYRQLS